MADVSVRPAAPADAEQIARVQLDTWRTAYSGVLPEDALDLPVEQVAALWLHAVEAPATPRHRVLVALERQELVGFAASAPPEELDPGVTVELATLLVVPRWGRRGHGSRLLAASVEAWRADGVRTAVTWCWERDPALQAFPDLGGVGPDGAVRGLDTGAAVQRQVRWHTDLE